MSAGVNICWKIHELKTKQLGNSQIKRSTCYSPEQEISAQSVVNNGTRHFLKNMNLTCHKKKKRNKQFDRQGPVLFWL